MLVPAGDIVKTDEVIAQIETDKVTIDVQHTGSKTGILTALNVAADDTVTVGQAIGTIDDDESKVQEAGGGADSKPTEKQESSQSSEAAKQPAEPEQPKQEKAEPKQEQKAAPSKPAPEPSKQQVMFQYGMHHTSFGSLPCTSRTLSWGSAQTFRCSFLLRLL